MGAEHQPRQRAVVIAGPTASGKSALALALAERLGGVVLNADAMQVYRDLRILTARPSDAEMARAPHELFGHVDAAEAYSVGRWLADVARVLEKVDAEGRRLILVGGTGLYLKALTQGLSDIPSVPVAIRDRVRADGEGRPPAELHDELARRDPVMAARLRPSDPQRILRALEVLAATGRSLAAFQDSRGEPLLPPRRFVGVRLEMDRQVLRDRIDRRFEAMMADGALDEIDRLAARGLDPDLPALRALGVPSLLAYRRGELSFDAAVARSKLLTRQYAKRQTTFARHQLLGFEPLMPGDVLSTISARLDEAGH